MPKKEFIDLKVDVVMLECDNILTASTFDAKDCNDDQWLGFEKWGV